MRGCWGCGGGGTGRTGGSGGSPSLGCEGVGSAAVVDCGSRCTVIRVAGADVGIAVSVAGICSRSTHCVRRESVLCRGEGEGRIELRYSKIVSDGKRGLGTSQPVPRMG